MTNLTEIQAHEVSRCVIYQRLSRCFMDPDKDLKNAVQSMKHHCSELRSRALPAVQSLCDEIKAVSTLERIRIDFARLFIGPYSLLAPPYGSIYLDNQRRIMGQSTMEVIRFYRHAGLEIAPTYKDAPDHIASELEFMYYLIFTEINELEKQDVDHVQPLIIDQCDFLDHHLSPWVPAFSQTLKAEAGTEFYRSLAEATECFIAEDRINLLNLKTVIEPPL